MDYSSIEGDFFTGEVKFLATGFINGKYLIISNEAIIKVKNSVHIRLIEHKFGKFPESFEIIAPLEAVKCVSGEIPDDYIKRLPASVYLELRQRIQGF